MIYFLPWLKIYQTKIVLITGASSVIGRACAEQFVQLGRAHAFCCVPCPQKQLIKVAEDIKKLFHADVYSFPLDVRDFNSVENQLHQLLDEWQNLDILINNTGFALGLAKLQEGEPNDWDTMIDTYKGRVVRHLLCITYNAYKRNEGSAYY